MRFVADCAVYFAQVRLMGIAVFKVGWFGFLRQVFHRTMTFQAPIVVDGGVECRQLRSMTVGAGRRGLGMAVVEIPGFGPGREDFFQYTHIFLRRSAP